MAALAQGTVMPDIELAVELLLVALAVVIVQVLALAIWPEIALFKPLDSYIHPKMRRSSCQTLF
jgi:hypothetical protein